MGAPDLQPLNFRSAFSSLRSRLRAPGGKRAVAGIGWLSSGNALTALFAAVQSIALARLLGPATYGLFVLAVAIPTLVGQVLESRSWEVILRFVTEYQATGSQAKIRGIVRTLVSIDAIVALVAVLVVAFLAPWAARVILQTPDASILVTVFSLNLLAAAPIGVASGILRAEERYGWLAGLDGAGAAVQTVALVVGAALGAPVLILLAILVSVTALKSVVAVLAARRAILPTIAHGADPTPLTRPERSAIVRYVLSASAFVTLKAVHGNADTLIVAALLNPAAAGIYRLATHFARVVAMPFVGFHQYAYREFSRLFVASEAESLQRLHRRLLAITAVIAGGGTVLLAWLGPVLIESTAGDAFSPAAAVLPWLAAAVALIVTTQYAQAFLMIAGRGRVALVVFSLAIVAQLALLPSLVASLSLVGAGVAALVGAAIKAGGLAITSAAASRPRRVVN